MPTSYVAGVAGVTALAPVAGANRPHAATTRAPLTQRIPPAKVPVASTLARHMLELIDAALAEDIGAGDVTTELLVPADAVGRAVLTQKAAGVIAGMRVAEAVFHRVDPTLRWHPHVDEGVWGSEGGLVAEVAGASRSILTAERVALNFMQRLSGVATLTARRGGAGSGTGARILDTRKPTPRLRVREKQAVLAGGGHNHRAGLFDAILVKENHSAMAGGVGEATRRALASAGSL